MVFDVLRVQREHVELLHETDHLRATEVAEGVTGKAQTNRRCIASRWRFVSHRSRCEEISRSGTRCRNHCARANEIPSGEAIPLRHAVPSPFRTHAPTSSSLPDLPEFVRLSCRDVVRGSPPTQRWKAAAS